MKVGLIWEQARSGWSLSESFLRAQRDHKDRRVVSLPLLHLVAYVGCVCMYMLSHVQLFVTPWTIAHQAPLSMEFYRQDHWWKSLSCAWLCNPTDYAAHGILQARILEWLAFLFSRGSFWSRNLTRISCIAGGFFINWAMREAQDHWSWLPFPSLRNLPDLGIESHLLHWQAGFLPLHHLGSHDKVHDCQIWSPGCTTEDNQVETRGKGAGFNL